MPALLDLFCGPGGAATGYARAGFDVVGVDSVAQPHFPFTFKQGDAFDWDLEGYDLVHASPPCDDHSSVTGRDRRANGEKGTGWMLAGIIERLDQAGVPWIVENVGSAKFPHGHRVIRLCGSTFGLDLRRHRLFATNLPLGALPCRHQWQTPRFRTLEHHRRFDRLATVVGVHGKCNYAGEGEIRNKAMDIDWMTQPELTQAVPPLYTQFLGLQAMAYLAGRTP